MTDHAAFAAAVQRPEERIDLAAAALLLARINAPVTAPERYLTQLDDYADWLRIRVDVRNDPERAVRQLSHYLAVDLGYHGNTRHYADPRNSCLNEVMERRTGIPISLSVIYLEVGWRLGMPLAGVGMPGHFVVKYRGEWQEIIFDPYTNGVILTEAECAERLAQVYGRPVAFEPHFLAAVTRKQILMRMLHNLKQIYMQRRDPDRLLETIEHLLLLSPWSLDDIRDRGLVRRQIGERAAAITDLETYLRFNEDASDAPLVRRWLAELHARQA